LAKFRFVGSLTLASDAGSIGEIVTWAGKTSKADCYAYWAEENFWLTASATQTYGKRCTVLLSMTPNVVATLPQSPAGSPY
jgi:hypothetical protein